MSASSTAVRDADRARSDFFRDVRWGPLGPIWPSGGPGFYVVPGPPRGADGAPAGDGDRHLLTGEHLRRGAIAGAESPSGWGAARPATLGPLLTRAALSGRAAWWNATTSRGTRLAPGCFGPLPPAGPKEEVLLLVDHDPRRPIASTHARPGLGRLVLANDRDGLVFRALGVPSRVLTDVRLGGRAECSAAYVVDEEVDDVDPWGRPVRRIVAAELGEISVVAAGACPGTRVRASSW